MSEKFRPVSPEEGRERLGLPPEATDQEYRDALEQHGETQKQVEKTRRQTERAVNKGEHPLPVTQTQWTFIDVGAQEGEESAAQALRRELIEELTEAEKIRGITHTGRIKDIKILDRNRDTGLSASEQMSLQDNSRIVEVAFEDGTREEVSIFQIAKDYKIVTE